MRRSLKTQTVFCLAFFLIAHSVRAAAFSLFGLKQDKGPKRGPAAISEFGDSRTVFFRTGRHEKRKDSRGREKEWVEIGYKWVDQSEADSKELLSMEGVAEVQFLDKEGFVLASQRVDSKDFIAGTEVYGFLWMEKDQAKGLQGARMRPVENQTVIEKVIEPVKEMPEPDREEKKESPKPSVAPDLVLPQPVDPFQRGGVTNEEIAETLQVFEKKPPTISGGQEIPQETPAASESEEEELDEEAAKEEAA